MPDKQIGIIGAGKVGVSLGKYFCEQGLQVQGFYSRTAASAEFAAEFTGTKVYDTYGDMVKKCNVLFLTVPDGQIASVWQQLKTETLAGKIICHCSGSLSSEIFSDIDKCGAFGYSIHPLYAIHSKTASYRELSQVLFTIEGSPGYLEEMQEFFADMGNPVQIMDSKDKVRYHAAASMVSNQMVGLYACGVDLLEQCGFSRENATQVLFGLAKGNLDAVGEKGMAGALTGPVERGDTVTVKKHLQTLADTPGIYDVYQALAKKLLPIAKEKNPERDYGAMEELLQEQAL